MDRRGERANCGHSSQIFYSLKQYFKDASFILLEAGLRDTVTGFLKVIMGMHMLSALKEKESIV